MLYAMLCRCFPFEKPDEKRLPRKDAMLKLMEVGGVLGLYICKTFKPVFTALILFLGGKAAECQQ